MTTDLRAVIEALRTALEEAITWPSSGTLQHAQANWRIAAAEYDALDAAPAPGLDMERLARGIVAAVQLRLLGGNTDQHYTPTEVAAMVSAVVEQQLAALAPSQPEDR